MGEPVPHLAGCAPVHLHWRNRQRFGGRPRRVPPFRPRQLCHPSQQPLRRPGRSSTRPSASVSQKCTPYRTGRAFFGALRGSVAWMPSAAPRTPQPRDTPRSPVLPACRSTRPDRTAPGQSRSDAPAPPDRRPAEQPPPAVPVWQPATAARWQTAGPPLAPRCRPPAPPAARTRSPRSPQRYKRRCPAATATHPDWPEIRPWRPQPAHRRASCAPLRNSQAPPRPTAPYPAAPPPALAQWGIGLRSVS